MAIIHNEESVFVTVQITHERDANKDVNMNDPESVIHIISLRLLN